MYVRGMSVALAFAALFASAACSDRGNSVTGPAPLHVGAVEEGLPPQGQPDSDTCRHSTAQWAIGESASQDLLERARVAAGAKTARFLRPNEVVTLEFAPWRLNLRLDEKDIVRAVVCG